jgi:hypothetical protein
VFRQIVQVAGFVGGKWSPHSLRHTFCTLTARAAWQATGDLVAARILTGHQDQKTLDAYLHRASEAMPQSLIGELGQASLPGILSPKLLEVGEIVAEAREIDRKLTGIAAAIVVPDREPELSSMTLVELAQRFPSDTPKAVIHRADARYRRAYNEAKRDGKDVEVCKERGTRARHGFMSAWRKAQQKARAELAKAGE